MELIIFLTYSHPQMFLLQYFQLPLLALLPPTQIPIQKTQNDPRPPPPLHIPSIARFRWFNILHVAESEPLTLLWLEISFIF